MEPLDNFGFDCDGSNKDVCLGVNSVYRVSFALALLHVLMLPISLAGG